MNPLGRIVLKFPSKTKEWLGRGVNMWWEVIAPPNKAKYVLESKQLISEGIEEYDNPIDISTEEDTTNAI